MTSLKTLIICKSVHHQNTARVASAMARVLDAHVLAPEDIEPSQVSNYDLIGIGSGVYFGQLHSELYRWIDSIPQQTSGRLKAFVFSTSGLPLLSWFWHRSIKSKLSKRGIDVIAEFECPGFDTVGPLRFLGGLNRGRPNDRDLDEAADFARLIQMIPA